MSASEDPRRELGVGLRLWCAYAVSCCNWSSATSLLDRLEGESWTPGEARNGIEDRLSSSKAIPEDNCCRNSWAACLDGDGSMEFAGPLLVGVEGAWLGGKGTILGSDLRGVVARSTSSCVGRFTMAK